MCNIVPQLDFGSAEHLKYQQPFSDVMPVFATKSYGIISNIKVNIFCLQISNIMCTVFVWIISVIWFEGNDKKFSMTAQQMNCERCQTIERQR